MKKLMIAAAIVCAAAFAQAATVGWSFGNIFAPGENGSGWSEDGLTGNVTVQMIVGTSLAEGIIGGQVYNDSTIVEFDGGYAYPDALVIAGMANDVPYYSQLILSYDDSTLTSGIFGLTATTAEEGMLYPNYGMGMDSSGMDDATTGSLTGLSTFGEVGGAFADAGWTTAVPEPTTGLLMLLGMAGLALRRRRA